MVLKFIYPVQQFVDICEQSSVHKKTIEDFLQIQPQVFVNIENNLLQIIPGKMVGGIIVIDLGRGSECDGVLVV